MVGELNKIHNLKTIYTDLVTLLRFWLTNQLLTLYFGNSGIKKFFNKLDSLDKIQYLQAHQPLFI